MAVSVSFCLQYSSVATLRNPGIAISGSAPKSRIVKAVANSLASRIVRAVANSLAGAGIYSTGWAKDYTHPALRRPAVALQVVSSLSVVPYRVMRLRTAREWYVPAAEHGTCTAESVILRLQIHDSVADINPA